MTSSSYELEIQELREARERHLTAASAVQSQLLAKRPSRRSGSFVVAGNSVPSAAVGGDFFDVFTLNDNMIDVVVGDVMGKGLTAALVAAGLKSQITRTLGLSAVSGRVPSPDELVQAIHDLFIDKFQALECYATLVYARIDAVRMGLDLVDCGHTRTLVWSAKSGKARFVSGSSLPLGVMRGLTFESTFVPLEPGDLVVIYSDGVTDTKASGTELGEAGLAWVIEQAARSNRSETCRAVEERLNAMGSRTELDDDFTFLCIAMPEDMSEVEVRRTVVTSCLQQIDTVRGLVSTAMQRSRHAWPDADRWMLEIAAVEVFTNIVRHAHARRSDQRVILETEDRRGAMEIRFRYSGEPFDPPAHVWVPEPRVAEGGYGLQVIHRTADSVEYQQDDRGQMWVTLRKNAPEATT